MGLGMRNAARRVTAGVALAGLVSVCGVTAANAKGACNLRAADAAAAGTDCARAWMDENLRLNDLLTVGTHNSYKQAIPEPDYTLIASQIPNLVPALDFAHKSLTAQLNAGARQLELDVVYDPRGGVFAHPLVLKFSATAMPAGWAETMAQPGFKVLHVADADFWSSCFTLKACLGEITAWSERHPDHVPILILINAKDGWSVPGGTRLLPFTRSAYDDLDAALREGLGTRLIVPDDVRGTRATLRDAVLHDGWPRLGQVRGKFLVALDETPAKTALYRGGHESLEQRVMFTNTSDVTLPSAAYVTRNDPVGEAAQIAADVRAGLIVRTRADSDTLEARANDVTRRDAALRSGAQWVSTDYLWPDARFTGGYQVRLPDHDAARCNPVRAATKCGGVPIETVAAIDAGAADGEALHSPPLRSQRVDPATVRRTLADVPQLQAEANSGTRP
jgi:hypothetical protein